jgi:hypothetical protein
MALPTVLSILVERHENPSSTSLRRTLTSQPLNLAIRIHGIILQRRQFLPTINSTPTQTLLLMFMFNLLGGCISLLLALLCPTIETED